MPKFDGFWVLVGIAVGLLLHVGVAHPKSPFHGLTGGYLGGNFYTAEQFTGG